jgi:hypothetical protein
MVHLASISHDQVLRINSSMNGRRLREHSKIFCIEKQSNGQCHEIIYLNFLANKISLIPDNPCFVIWNFPKISDVTRISPCLFEQIQITEIQYYYQELRITALYYLTQSLYSK